MKLFALGILLVAGFTAPVCWFLASVRKSRRWAGLAIALAAIAGFSLCPAMSVDERLPDILLLSVGMAALAAIGIAAAMWWVERLRKMRL